MEEADKAGEETSRRILQLEGEVKAQLKTRGMTVAEDVDLAAFQKAGDKAYEALKLTDVKNAVHKEIGKQAEASDGRQAARGIPEVLQGRGRRRRGRLLVMMVALIFTGGVSRVFGHPLNWSTDAATCLFAWACFLCADIAWRSNSMMAIELVTSRLPARPRQWLRYLNSPSSCAFLVYVIWLGLWLSWTSRVRSLPGHSGDQLLLGDDEHAGRRRAAAGDDAAEDPR